MLALSACVMRVRRCGPDACSHPRRPHPQAPEHSGHEPELWQSGSFACYTDCSVNTALVYLEKIKKNAWKFVLILVGWMCSAPHRQWGHLGTAPQFTVDCKGRQALFLHCSHWELNPRPFAGVCGRSGKDFPVGSHPRH